MYFCIIKMNITFSKMYLLSLKKKTEPKTGYSVVTNCVCLFVAVAHLYCLLQGHWHSNGDT